MSSNNCYRYLMSYVIESGPVMFFFVLSYNNNRSELGGVVRRFPESEALTSSYMRRKLRHNCKFPNMYHWLA